MKVFSAWLRALRSVPFLFVVLAERARQEFRWGPQHHPAFPLRGPVPRAIANGARRDCDDEAKRGDPSWCAIFNEECFEAMSEPRPRELRRELVQSAAVAAAWHDDTFPGR